MSIEFSIKHPLVSNSEKKHKLSQDGQTYSIWCNRLDRVKYVENDKTIPIHVTHYHKINWHIAQFVFEDFLVLAFVFQE